jgi:hypothetical protein
LLLSHQLFKSSKSGEAIDESWLRLRYPAYWHYGILPALNVLARMELVGDPRAEDSLKIFRAKRLPSGKWPTEGSWWKAPGSTGSQVEAVEWSRNAPSEMVTLQALRIIASAQRWPDSDSAQ